MHGLVGSATRQPPCSPPSLAVAQPRCNDIARIDRCMWDVIVKYAVPEDEDEVIIGFA